MGIDGIDILKPDGFSPANKVRERKAVSQHIRETETVKYVFGWDQPLTSFYLQVFDTTLEEKDNPVIWLAPPLNFLYDVEDLVRAAIPHGLLLTNEERVKLREEKGAGI